MFTRLHRWWIEVDQDREQPNRSAQLSFIRDFGNELYCAAEQPDSPLRLLRCVYFTRIFAPERDGLGAYVRLHFFVGEQDQNGAVADLDRRLEKLRQKGAVFQIRKETIDGIQEAKLKAAASFPDLYYRYMEFLSRTAVQLFQKGVAHGEMDKLLWTWTHNFFNLLRGYNVSILEFPPGIPVRSWSI